MKLSKSQDISSTSSTESPSKPTKFHFSQHKNPQAVTYDQTRTRRRGNRMVIRQTIFKISKKVNREHTTDLE